MTALSRRAVLASGAVLATHAVTPVGAAKPESDDVTVRVKVSDTVADAGLSYLPAAVARDLGVDDGQQVRLVYDGSPALFTVVVTDDRWARVSPGGRDRLGATKNSFRADPSATVVHPTMDRETAAETGEYIERAVTGDTTAIGVAPHGGYVEYGTDGQASRFGDRLGGTAWYAAGWWPGGGAYRRWHVTSTRLHPASFPLLGDLANTGFETAVSFHGWGESHVGVGGAAPLELRTAIRDGLATALDGVAEVKLATDPTRDGSDPENVVNWLTASGTDGVQLEQPLAVRQKYGGLVADTVSDVVARQVA